MLLFFIRHGDPIYHPDHLTPLGERQAEAIGRRLARYGLDEIYASSSTRAMQTAQPTCELLKKDFTILDWANEEYTWQKQSVILPDGKQVWSMTLQETQDAMTSKQIRDLGNRWYEHPYFAGTTFVEGFFNVQRETRAFLLAQGFSWDEEKGQYQNLNFTSGNLGKRVALFAHHGFGTNFLSTVLDIPYPQICLKTNYQHTGMTVIRFEEDKPYTIPQMLTMSNDGHLLADNLPSCYNNQIYY